MDKPDYISGDIFVLNPNPQTLKAWEPFWDCVSILLEMQNSDFVDDGNQLPEWRTHWITGITLLRAVGHVLVKVDAAQSISHRSAIGQLWSNMRRDREKYAIFWEFINKERNNILKTYQFGARFMTVDGEYRIIYSDGTDAFQIFRWAVYWWRKELILLENSLICSTPS